MLSIPKIAGAVCLATMMSGFATVAEAAPPEPATLKKQSCPVAVERTLKVIKDGVTHKGEVVGNRLMIFTADGRSAPAPDGIYLMPNGEKIVVK